MFCGIRDSRRGFCIGFAVLEKKGISYDRRNMKSFLFSVMAVSLCSAVIGMIAPEGVLKKQITFVCSAAVCAALVLPILGIFSDIPGQIKLPSATEDIPSESGKAEDAIISLAVENICTEMERQVSERFEIKNACLVLEIDSSDKSAVNIVSGTLYGEGELEDAAQYIEKELGCEIGYQKG